MLTDLAQRYKMRGTFKEPRDLDRHLSVVEEKKRLLTQCALLTNKTLEHFKATVFKTLWARERCGRDISGRLGLLGQVVLPVGAPSHRILHAASFPPDRWGDNGSVQETLLPLFPLELVLLPANVLPLRIFEDRYKEMIGEAIANDTEFGIVQAGDKGILNLGCTASVLEVLEKYPDGRMDIVCVGKRRFEILYLDNDKPYLRGAVNFFSDMQPETPAPLSLRLTALAGYELQRNQEGVERADLDPDDPQLSFKTVQYVSDLPFRQTLLAMRSEAERLTHINEYFPQYLANLKRSAHVRKVGPTNGHGFIALGKKDT